MDQIVGKKYKLKTSDNFDEYLKYIGVGFISRKTANSVSPVCVVTQNDDGSYTLAMMTTLRNIYTTFKLDEEFEEERADGTKVKSTIVLEGNKLIQTQIEPNGRKSVHVREFTPKTLTVTSTAEGWNGQCIRVYELVE
ncbi:PREDICTED: fatty acid-binding protein-like [Papilio xuthus]|uniref:Fatty acid-binding protein n=1 Tax=Papilio xuthus TaxID=66420 RepID=A0A194PZX5_PAPXU|nr:PREDICTED: fatty acid-binding protein-like [Papilio xuthus]KPI98871.1 Fatty acid-binding protein [Papilio xuthus]